MVLSLGGDPAPLMVERDPVAVGLWIEVASRAARYALVRDRKQATDVALMLSGKKPSKLEV